MLESTIYNLADGVQVVTVLSETKPDHERKDAIGLVKALGVKHEDCLL